MTYRPGGVDDVQLTRILDVVAVVGYCPHNGYAPLTGALTAEDVLVTPTMKKSSRFSEIHPNLARFLENMEQLYYCSGKFELTYT